MRVRAWLSAVVIGAAFLLFAPLAASAQNAQAACDVKTTERVVAVGDVHGAYDGFVALLREAGLIDMRNRWIGGRAVLVQTGDVVDRGADSRKVLDLLRTLEREAARAGGRVWALLGNHEVMRMIGDWRYVSAGEYAAFRNGGSRQLQEEVLTAASAAAEERGRREGRPFDARAYREQFLKDIPLGYIEMRDAFAPRGDYGSWLRNHVAAVKINGVLFVHGGISPEAATRGCAGINEAVGADLRVPMPTLEQGLAMFSSTESGPLWYRGLTAQPDAIPTEQVEAVLTAVQARAIVVGHTVTTSHRIETRHGGRVIQIDTGMLTSVYKGGLPSALEITDKAVTAIYVGRPRAAVPTAALGAP